MKKRVILILMILAMTEFLPPVKAETNVSDVPVEIVEIRESEISSRDEGKIVIEIRWRPNPALVSNVGSYRLLLSVTYSDGTFLIVPGTASAEDFSARVEVPKHKVSNRRPLAEIKKMKALVVAVLRTNPI